MAPRRKTRKVTTSVVPPIWPRFALSQYETDTIILKPKKPAIKIQFEKTMLRVAQRNPSKATITKVRRPAKISSLRDTKENSRSRPITNPTPTETNIRIKKSIWLIWKFSVSMIKMSSKISGLGTEYRKFINHFTFTSIIH